MPGPGNFLQQKHDMDSSEGDYAKIFELSGMGKDIVLKAKINAYLADMIHMHHTWGIPMPEELIDNSKKHRLHAPEIFDKPDGR